MTKLATILAVLAALLGCAVGFVVGHSAKDRTATVTVAGRVTTVRTPTPTRTVTTPVVHTHTVTTPAPAEPTSTASTDCNDLPASASTNLSEIRESRCEMEKLNAGNPSAANEHEIETMISDERAIEASE
jgi:translation elongation factor EF-1alpha